MDEEEVQAEQLKQLLTDSMSYCIELLKSFDLINDKESSKLCPNSQYLGAEIAKSIISLMQNLDNLEQEELFLFEEGFGDICDAEDQQQYAESQALESQLSTGKMNIILMYLSANFSKNFFIHFCWFIIFLTCFQKYFHIL